jgi:hypothetical protein
MGGFSMMETKVQKYEEAKKLYNHYNGSRYFMQHEDDLDKYISFNVPKEIERQWHDEIEMDMLNAIKHERNLEKLQMFCSNFISITDINGLVFLRNFLLNNSKYFDTFTNIRLVESLFDRMRLFAKMNKTISLKVMKETLCFLSELVKEPIVVSTDYYNENGTKPEYLSKEKLIKRMNSRIKEYSNLYEKIKNEDKVLLLK